MVNTYQTDVLNIDLEWEREGFEHREVDEDELKEDFDETKGLGRPSVDSFTMREVDIEDFIGV